jgi:hypothetical protein
MLSICLLHGLLLGQAEAPRPSPTVTTIEVTTSREGSPESRGAPGEISVRATETHTEAVAPPADSSSLFARPFFADRHALSWFLDAGPGRFNMIDWESRPNGDHLWWLGRWPSCEDVQLHAMIGFGIHWWAGPISRVGDPAPELPPRVFDLYLDTAWAQRWTDRLTSEIRVRPGLYTDFRTTPPDSFRIPGQAVALFQVNPELYLVGGVEHVQRNDVHLLPVGGFLWQPTPQWELRLVFPEPKIAYQLSSRHHVWGYVAAEYGGGRWTFKNDDGKSERVEVSDYRGVFGLEWRDDYFSKLSQLPEKSASFIEMGYVFERHVRFASGVRDFEPKPAWMIRFGRVW